MFSTSFYIGHTNTNIDIQRYGLTSKILVCQLLSYIQYYNNTPLYKSGVHHCLSDADKRSDNLFGLS